MLLYQFNQLKVLRTWILNEEAISDRAASALKPVFNVPVFVDDPAIDGAPRKEATAVYIK